MQSLWKGPKAVLYMSLDGAEGLVLMEGFQEINHIPLVSGQVCEQKFNFAQEAVNDQEESESLYCVHYDL